ncbi:MAG: hypothetical protein ACHQFX_01215 [Chitinophagales bacterium]
MEKQNNGKKGKDKTRPALKPDEKTLHKTDPQENMEGPVSSAVQNVKALSEKNDEESKQKPTGRKTEICRQSILNSSQVESHFFIG